MRSAIIIFLAAIIACAEMYPDDKNKDITWDTKVGDGKLFGTLGQDKSGLFGKAGYNTEIFNDDRGKLTAEGYGKRVLGATHDSTRFGSKVDWTNDQSQFGIDISKKLGGRTKVFAGGEGVWDLDKNTRFTAGGGFAQTIGRGHPRAEFGATFHHDW